MTTPTPDGGAGDADRLARLERAVDELRQEVAALRAARPAPAPPAAPRADPVVERLTPSAPRPPAPRRAFDGLAARLGVGPVPADRGELEALVGRYGTVALAALLILMGVGALLTWAIANVTLGPGARVALGGLAAVALAGAGWRLRSRAAAGGTRRFGNVLLGIALAVVHVDAWGAGPYLGLVPPAVALAVAAVASAAVAALARRAREQSLFVVGVGGALVAPFVAGAAAGDVTPLAVYGWLVLTSGLLALPRSAGVRWSVAARLLGVGAAAYASVLLDGVLDVPRPARPDPVLALWRAAPALFPLVSAATAVAFGFLARGGAAYARGLALAYLATALAAAGAVALDSAAGEPALVAVALAGTLGVYAALALPRPAPAARPNELPPGPARPPVRATASALALPLGFLAAALVALPDPVSAAGAAAALAWGALAGASAWAARGEGGGRVLLGAHVAAAGLASALVPFLLLPGRDVARVVALAAHAAAFAFVYAWARARLALVPPLVVLAAAGGTALLLLRARAAYAYTPFATAESLAAAAAVAACGALAWQGWRARPTSNGMPNARPNEAPNENPAAPPAALSARERAALVALAPAAALLWGREELRSAVSPDVATFLLVGYFAAAGVAAIFAGRARRLPAARQAGLALAVYAALKAIAEASDLDSVGLRVGSYLLAGGFLLAVGYWYRDNLVRRNPYGVADTT